MIWGRHEPGTLSLDVLEEGLGLSGAYVVDGPVKRYQHVTLVPDDSVFPKSAEISHEVTRARLTGAQRISQRLAVHPLALEALRFAGEVDLGYKYGTVHLRMRHLEYVQTDLFEDAAAAAA